MNVVVSENRVFVCSDHDVLDSGLTKAQERLDYDGLGPILDESEVVGRAALDMAAIVFPDGSCVEVRVREGVLSIFRDGVEVSTRDRNGLERALYSARIRADRTRVPEPLSEDVVVRQFPKPLTANSAEQDIIDFFAHLSHGDFIRVGYTTYKFISFNPKDPLQVRVKPLRENADIMRVSTSATAIRQVSRPPSLEAWIRNGGGVTRRMLANLPRTSSIA